MNFVKTKLALVPLSAGQRLEVLLDDGPAIQNVPRSVVEEGRRIVDQRKQGEHWTVLIEKR
jgi:TusA-related sulfurtransferase